jgi:hypothetical protein
VHPRFPEIKNVAIFVVLEYSATLHSRYHDVVQSTGGLPAIWQAGLGQGHNQKKDTRTLDFDVTLGGGQGELIWACILHLHRCSAVSIEIFKDVLLPRRKKR